MVDPNRGDGMLDPVPAELPAELPAERPTPVVRDPFDLRGRTALVSGASRGIGAGIARALDRHGARVALAARDEARLAAVAAELTNDPIILPVDLADADAATELGHRAVAALGAVDVLVHNAAVAKRKPSHEYTAAEIDAMFAVNVRAVLLLNAAIVPSMLARRSGSIVMVSSVSSQVGTPMRAAYAATKGAVDAMTRGMAMEYGPSGIRVNGVAPGVVETDLWVENLAKPGVRDGLIGLTALRRLSTPDDVADVVVFLAADASRYVTGETLRVDGGMASTLNLYPTV